MINISGHEVCFEDLQYLNNDELAIIVPSIGPRSRVRKLIQAYFSYVPYNIKECEKDKVDALMQVLHSWGLTCLYDILKGYL